MEDETGPLVASDWISLPDGASWNSEDLATVVTRLSPKLHRGIGERQRDVDDDCRILLEAGVRALVDRYCTHQDDPSIRGYVDANEIMGSVSIREIMKHFATTAASVGRNPGAANTNRLTHRWNAVAEYHRDLLAYVFRPTYHAARIRRVHESLNELLTMTFGDLVRTLAVAESDGTGTDEMTVLQVTLQAAFPSDPEIRRLVSVQYAAAADAWSEIYAAILSAYGLAIPSTSELNLVDVAHILNLVVEGAGLRRAASTDAGTLSGGEHIATKTVQMVLSQALELPWRELAGLRAQ